MTALPPDLCAMLDLPPDADDATVKRAYRTRAMAWHPDRNAGDAATAARFHALNAAYGAWSAREAPGDAAPAPGPASTNAGAAASLDLQQLEGMFADLFGAGGAFGGQARAGRSARGADLRVELQLTEAEARRGTRREVSVRRAVACSTCDGSGAAPGSGMRECSVCAGRGQVVNTAGGFKIARVCELCGGQGRRPERACSDCERGLVPEHEKLKVTVPAGVSSGQCLRLQGKGNGRPGGVDGEAGDLYLALEVAPGAEGTRVGDDAHVEALVDAAAARAGTRIVVAAPVGDVDVDVAPGARTGTEVRVRGAGYSRGAQDDAAGAAYRDAAARGDLVVRVRLRGDDPRRGRVAAVALGLCAIGALVAAILAGRP